MNSQKEIPDESNKCKWVVRPGTQGTYWAYTPCKSGFNYLSRINKPEQIKPAYDGRLCPICHKPIECNTKLLDDEELE